MTQGIVQVPPQARQEVVVNNATTPQKKSSANVIPTEMMRRIEIADRDGLYTALWVDVDGDGNVGNNDRIVEADMYLPLEKMWFIRSTPQRRSLKLYVVDMDLGKAIISGETNNGSERGLSGTFGVLPMNYIQNQYVEKPIGVKTYRIQTVDTETGDVYAFREFKIQFSK